MDNVNKLYSTDSINALLEERMLNYTDYIDIPVAPIDEALIPITPTPGLFASQIGKDMRPYTGDQVFVREGVYANLAQAAEELLRFDATMQLEVVYGYRALEIQQRLFEQAMKRYPELDGDRLLARTHKDIAIPQAAGHPTGGAIDIQIIQNNKPLDFGTKIWEFNANSFTFSPFVSKEAWQNRQLLRRCMMQVGFAPFDGEWWHFSYGDKEWARYYNNPAALYDQVNFKANNQSS